MGDVVLFAFVLFVKEKNLKSLKMKVLANKQLSCDLLYYLWHLLPLETLAMTGSVFWTLAVAEDAVLWMANACSLPTLFTYSLSSSQGKYNHPQHRRGRWVSRSETLWFPGILHPEYMRPFREDKWPGVSSHICVLLQVFSFRNPGQGKLWALCKASWEGTGRVGPQVGLWPD